MFPKHATGDYHIFSYTSQQFFEHRSFVPPSLPYRVGYFPWETEIKDLWGIKASSGGGTKASGDGGTKASGDGGTKASDDGETAQIRPVSFAW